MSVRGFFFELYRTFLEETARSTHTRSHRIRAEDTKLPYSRERSELSGQFGLMREEELDHPRKSRSCLLSSLSVCIYACVDHSDFSCVRRDSHWAILSSVFSMVQEAHRVFTLRISQSKLGCHRYPPYRQPFPRLWLCFLLFSWSAESSDWRGISVSERAWERNKMFPIGGKRKRERRRLPRLGK